MNVNCFICLKRRNKPKKIPSLRLFVCLSVCLGVRMWSFAVETITFEGVSGSKENLVGVFYVWNLGLVLKSKVKSWSWSWSWTGFWFYQKLCGTIPNSVGIFRTQSITFVIDFDSEILILILKKKFLKILWNETVFHEHHWHVKHNFIINDYQMVSWSWFWSKFDWIEELTQIDWLKIV